MQVILAFTSGQGVFVFADNLFDFEDAKMI